MDLTPKGIEEARKAGKSIVKSGLDFEVCYTSYLKRALHTLNLVLEEMEREWLPAIKTFNLNERHYGALQELNKVDTSEIYGEDHMELGLQC